VTFFGSTAILFQIVVLSLDRNRRVKFNCIYLKDTPCNVAVLLSGRPFARHRIRMFTRSKSSNFLHKKRSVIVTFFGSTAILLQIVVLSLDRNRRVEFNCIYLKDTPCNVVVLLSGRPFARHRIRMFTRSKSSNFLHKKRSVVVTFFGSTAILFQIVVLSLDRNRRLEFNCIYLKDTPAINYLTYWTEQPSRGPMNNRT
jgi:preprotein translocase subunit SecG